MVNKNIILYIDSYVIKKKGSILQASNTLAPSGAELQLKNSYLMVHW